MPAVPRRHITLWGDQGVKIKGGVKLSILYGTCTSHSGVKKTHDWAVGQLPDLFRTTHTTKTQQVVRIRGQYCGDVEVVGYLANGSDPVPLVLDLRIAHDHFGSSSDPILNGQLHYPGYR
jgi:hypothetical protein